MTTGFAETRGLESGYRCVGAARFARTDGDSLGGYLLARGAVRCALDCIQGFTQGVGAGLGTPERKALEEQSKAELSRLVSEEVRRCQRFLRACSEGVSRRLEASEPAGPSGPHEGALDPVWEDGGDPVRRLSLRAKGTFELGRVDVELREGQWTWSVCWHSSRVCTAAEGTNFDADVHRTERVEHRDAEAVRSPPHGREGDAGTPDPWLSVHVVSDGGGAEPKPDVSELLAVSLPGMSHVLGGGTPCQDAAWARTDASGRRILAVSDGHGAERYLHSDVGARIAVGVVHDLLPSVVPTEREPTHAELESSIHRIRAALLNEWNRRVRLHHHVWAASEAADPGARNNDDVDGSYEDAVRSYGATLLGVVVYREWLVAVQLGDGDIVCVEQGPDGAVGRRLFGAAEKPIDSATASLASPGALGSFERRVMRFDPGAQPLDAAPVGDEGASEGLSRLRLVLLATDGVSDPYIPEDEKARAAARARHEVEVKEVFPTVWGTGIVKELDEQGDFDRWALRLPGLLARLSTYSGDDVSVAVAFWPQMRGRAADESLPELHVAPRATADPPVAFDGGPSARLDGLLEEERRRCQSSEWASWAKDVTATLVAEGSGLSMFDIALAAGYSRVPVLEPRGTDQESTPIDGANGAEHFESKEEEDVGTQER
jgi:hypothetical protein